MKTKTVKKIIWTIITIIVGFSFIILPLMQYGAFGS